MPAASRGVARAMVSAWQRVDRAGAHGADALPAPPHRERIRDRVVGAHDHLRIRGDDRLERYWRGELRQVGEHVAPAAEFDDLADDVPAVHGVDRLIVELDEHAHGPRRPVETPQLGDFPIESGGGGLGHRWRPGDRTDGPERDRYVGETVGRDLAVSELERIETLDHVVGRARRPGQDNVRLQGQQPFHVDAPGVADARQASRLRGVIAVLDDADEEVARARGVHEFGEMWREAHDPRPRRCGPRRGAGEQHHDGEQGEPRPHAPASSVSKRSSARSSGQSKASPGSVLRPGATSLWPTTASTDSPG